MKEVINKYIENHKIQFHRYQSWDHCFEEFAKDGQNKLLHLSFFLASWGMYRGSSMLLQKNSFIHNKAIDILSKTKYQHLKCSKDQEVSTNDIPAILDLTKELKGYYAGEGVTPTDTLISKIMLGTLSCTPAYDQYFRDGLKIEGITGLDLDNNSLNRLFAFIRSKENKIKGCQDLVKDQLKLHYPVMKIVDMYFWQIGFQESLRRKRHQKPDKTINRLN